MSAKEKESIVKLLAQADVEINGSRPWDIEVHDERFYKRALSGGSLAIGEAYMDAWWECDAAHSFVNGILDSIYNIDYSGRTSISSSRFIQNDFLNWSTMNLKNIK